MSKIIVAIGQDAKLLDKTSRVFGRHIQYASGVDEFHAVVATPTHKEIHEGNLHIYGVGGKYKLLIAWRVFYYAYRIARTRQVVVTSQDPFALGLLAYKVALFSRNELNIQVHGDFYSTFLWRKEHVSHFFLAYLGLFILRQAHSVRVVSERIKRSLIEEGINRAKIKVLPIDMSLEAFLNAKPTPLWENNTEETIILAVGRFSVEKNFQLLISAFKTVWEQCSQARLILVGEGSEQENLIKLVKSLWTEKPPVSFFTWQQNIAGVMKAADIVAVTSNYEGYAMVIGEAMAAVKPVVTTEVGCVGELFINNVHGITVNVGDEIALANALILLVQNKDLRQQYGAAAQATASQLSQIKLDVSDYLNALGI